MKILYLSSLFMNFIHYPINKLQECFGLEYFTFFFRNRYSYVLYKNHKKTWDIDNITNPLPVHKYKIIEYLGLPKDLFIDFYSFFIFFKIKRYVNKNDYDLIHAHCLHPSGIVAFLLQRKYNIPYIVTAHGNDFYSVLNNKLLFFPHFILKKLVYNTLVNASAVIAVSDSFGVDISKFCPVAKVIAVENTFNIDIFKPRIRNKIFCTNFTKCGSTEWNKKIIYHKDRLNFNKDTNKLNNNRSKIKKNDLINLLSIGFFIERKNHLLILQALKELLKKYNKLRLTLVGTGKLLPVYKKFIHNNSMTDIVIIKDFMPQHNLVSVYHNADIFILPSKSEPFGMVCIEAMATGLIVLSSNTHGPSKIINHNTDGFIFENNSIDDLIKKLIFIIEHKENWQEIAKHAILKAEKYKTKHYEVYDIYKKVLFNRGANE